jgi:hypothetical protein
MMSDQKIPENESSPAGDEEKLEFSDNPYAPETRRPEDIVRLFYVHDMPIIPVASKRGIILGILKKEDLISELSDIERAEKQKIDRFVTRLARKVTIDDLLPYGHIKEFVVINLFGEVLGKWPRIQLFNAVESFSRVDPEAEAEKVRDDQVLEWMIYLILEHIPRALYAVNSSGKTIFYNSIFEDVYTAMFKVDVDSAYIENTLKNPDKNELVSDGYGSSIHFYNTDLGIKYERVPLMSKGERAGYLIYIDSNGAPAAEDAEGQGEEKLDVLLSRVERERIVLALKRELRVEKAAKSLGISKKSLVSRMQRLGIHLNQPF